MMKRNVVGSAGIGIPVIQPKTVQFIELLWSEILKGRNDMGETKRKLKDSNFL
jgi:hypothetical protein